MNYKILLKTLLILLGIILFIFAIKILTVFLPTDFDFLSPNKSDINVPNRGEETDDKDVIFFPLQAQYGFTLDGVKGCSKDYKSGIFEKEYSYSTSGSCWNSSCALNISFSEKIPKDISLYVIKNGHCELEKFEVPNPLDTVGYSVDLQLTQTQKNNLSIIRGDEVKLKKANGYSLDSKNQFYFYDNKLAEDIILVNGKEKGKVYFSKEARNKSSKTIDDSSVSSSKIDIPHPKEIFTITCDSNRICEQVANSYLVNIDGIYFIPNDEFIVKCMRDKSASKYCNIMINIGHISTPKFQSDAEMNRYIKVAKNPEFNDDLKDWEKARFIKAKEKIVQSMK